MIDIILDCDKEVELTIKTYLNSLCDINLIDYKSIKNNFILIKEIKENKDLRANRELNELNFDYILISIISNEQNIFDLLDLHKTFFIRKNNIEKDLYIINDSIKDFINSVSSFIELITNYEHVLINIHSIIYIESLAHDIIIHTTNGEFKSRKKLSDIYEQLKYFDFIQIHKSYLVNKKYITQILSKEIKLAKSTILPIGRKYKINVQNI